MMKGRIAIDDRTRSILSEMTVSDGVLLPYTNQLPRGEYENLDKVLRALGGKWKRGKGHVFPDHEDVEALIETALVEGHVIDKAKALGFYETPVELADRIVHEASPRKGERILEPSAGRGAIAEAIRRLHPECEPDLHCFEIDPGNRKILFEKGFGVLGHNFLADLPEESRYDVIVANPPFNSRADVIHVTKMLGHLKQGGRLVAIMAAGVAFRTDRLTADLRERITMKGAIMPLDEGTFKAAGTMVNTVLVKVTA